MIRLFIFLLLIFVSGCDETPLELNNEFDPSNPDHVPPNIESIYTTPGMVNGIINANSVTIEYEGNIEDLEFQYQLDGAEWSEWDSESRVTLNFLDEGSHIFLVQCRYLSGEIEVNPDTLQFEIDAIDGPALRIFPLFTEIPIGQEFTIEVMAENLDPVAAMELVLTYDINHLNIIEDNIDYGEFFSGCGTPIMIKYLVKNDYSGIGTIIIDIGCYGGVLETVSGYGSIISIKATADMTGFTDIEFEYNDILLRDANNEPVELEEAWDGLVEIQ